MREMTLPQILICTFIFGLALWFMAGRPGLGEGESLFTADESEAVPVAFGEGLTLSEAPAEAAAEEPAHVDGN